MRYVRARQNMREIAQAFPLDVVVYEEVRRHRGVDAAHVYGGVVAQITAFCEEEGIPYRAYPVGTIKKRATGKGNADKVAVARAALARWTDLEGTITCETKTNKKGKVTLKLSEEGDHCDALWAAACFVDEWKPPRRPVPPPPPGRP
jgi:hypothetical protein